MALRITGQTILIPATPSQAVEPGMLLFADDVLMAAVMFLDQPVEDGLRGQWFLETGYGPCAVAPGAEVLFQTPDEAKAWVLERVTRARAMIPRKLLRGTEQVP